MALRVLLADESATIKKVFQLALQDYAVDVTAVSLGPDVVSVTRQFKPDIIFSDILLPKRNGYDVCADIKGDQALKDIPVVLMWSGFMDLDEDKMQAARADGKLEKPFDVQDLRNLVQNLVPKTQAQKLGQFLQFPKMPEFQEPARPATPPPAAKPPAPTTPQPPRKAPPIPMAGPSSEPEMPSEEITGSWNMESFDPIPEVSPPNVDQLDDFQEVPLPPPPKADEIADLEAVDDQEATQWATSDLNKFRVKPQDNEDDIAVHIQDEEESTHLDVSLDLNEEPMIEPEIEMEMEPPRIPTANTNVNRAVNSNAPIAISEEDVERIVRAQAKGLIEAIAWKVVPDLAQQIIERELKRLLADKSP